MTFVHPVSEAPPLAIPKQLSGQKALVTGANSGIGRAVALALGQAGADVMVNYISGDEIAQTMVEEIKQAGSDATAYRADVSSEDQVESMFDQMIKQFGTIDILVNNAGLQRDAPFQAMPLDQWNQVISVNLMGQFLCARAAVREFIRRGVVPSVSAARCARRSTGLPGRPRMPMIS
jgi:glucose 1-dehydrogenase